MRLAHGVPLVASRFDSMTGATTGGPAPRRRAGGTSCATCRCCPSCWGPYQRGWETAGPCPYEQMSERLRREILALDATFSSQTRARAGSSWSLRGSGVGLEE